jgi:hypothetical protein
MTDVLISTKTGFPLLVMTLGSVQDNRQSYILSVAALARFAFLLAELAMENSQPTNASRIDAAIVLTPVCVLASGEIGRGYRLKYPFIHIAAGATIYDHFEIARRSFPRLQAHRGGAFAVNHYESTSV